MPSSTKRYKYNQGKLKKLAMAHKSHPERNKKIHVIHTIFFLLMKLSGNHIVRGYCNFYKY